MEKRENYLLFVPSLLTSRAEKLTYTAGEKHWEYQCLQTNEAVSRYLVDLLHEQGTKLTKIILLCSKEVCNTRLDLIGGRTTLKYYQESLWNFLEKYREDYQDFFSLFEIIPLNSEHGRTAEEIVAPVKQVLAITEEKSSSRNKHLYVDFTGGMRNAALTLVFACRILQHMGVMVDKILYSNINSKTVEECTRTYEYFEDFEYRIKREYNPDNFDRYDENISKLPENEQKIMQEIITNMKGLQEKKELNRFSEVADSSKRTLANVDHLKANANKQPLSESAKALLTRIEEDCQENVQNIADNEKYPELPLIEKYLQRGQYDSALNLYREKIVNILYKGQIIQVGNRFLKIGKNGKKELKEFEVTQEIIGVYCYYEHPDGRIYPHKTFMDGVQYVLKQLNTTPNQPPKEVFQKNILPSFHNLLWYLEKEPIPSKGFIHNDFSRNICNTKILPYLEKDYGVSNMNDFIDKYNKLDRIYMCYGFPFAATYDKWFLNGYDQTYRKLLNKGIECLQDFYDGKNNSTIQKMLSCFPEEHFTYETLIHALLENKYQKILHILFPYQLDSRKIYSNILKGEQWDDFIYSFVKSFCLIKNVRNSKIHKTDLKSEDMRKAIKEIEANLNLIKKYIR